MDRCRGVSLFDEAKEVDNDPRISVYLESHTTKNIDVKALKADRLS